MTLKDAAALIARLPDVEMGDASVDSISRDGELAPNVSLGPFQKLSLNLRGALAVRILNGPEDEDEDGIAGQTSAADGSALAPQLLLTKDGPTWLKYRLEAGIKVAGSAAVSALDFEFEGEAAAILADYRIHGRKQRVVQAVTDDLSAGPRVAFSLADVRKQPTGGALAVRLYGKLSASATVTWSDVFTTQLGSVLSATGVKTAIGLKVAAGASVTGSVALVDDFIVVFTRVADARWSVAVRKARERRLGAQAKAGVSVAFDKSEQVQAVLDSYLEGILGAPLKEIKAAVGKASLESLSPTQRKIADRLLEVFGIGEVPDRLARLKEKVEALEKNAEEALAQAAKAKLEVGFAYEYSRLDTAAVLLEAELDEAALKARHREVVWGKLERALAAEGEGVTVKRYLNEKSAQRTRSWGFTLGLDKWKVAGTDKKSLGRVDRRDITGRVQRSYKGLRGYEGKWVSRNWSWEVDFNAAMGGFSAAADKPRVSEFKFGLGVVWHQEGKKLKSGDIDELMDTARIWRIVDEAGLAAARRLVESVEDKPYKATLQLVLDPGTFWDIRPLLIGSAAAGGPSMAGALAEAMPWWAGMRPFSPAQRRSAFEKLWESHLSHPGTPVSPLLVDQLASPQIAFIERNNQWSPYTFLGLANLNDTAPAFAHFARGLRSLDEAIRNGEFDDGRIPDIFDDLDDFFAQSHHVRALGVYLLDAVARRGTLGDVKRSLLLAPREEGKWDPIVVAPAM